MIPLSWPLLLSAALFTTGIVGVLVRRNAIVIFMSVELMRNAGNLAFVALARRTNSAGGRGVGVVVVSGGAAAAQPAGGGGPAG